MLAVLDIKPNHGGGVCHLNSCRVYHLVLLAIVPIRLDGLAEQLEDIAATQGTNVDKIISLVNENEEILNDMKANLRQTVVASLAKIVMRSDGKCLIGGWNLHLRMTCVPYHVLYITTDIFSTIYIT